MASPGKADKRIHSLLVLGAIEAELADLEAAMRGGASRPVHIVGERESLFLQKTKLQIRTALCGVGSLQAALFLENYLRENPLPDEILFLGSAGAYSKESDLVGCFALSRHFFCYDALALEGNAKIPEPLPSELLCLPGLIFKSLESLVEPSAAGQSASKKGGRDAFRKARVNTTSSVTLRELRIQRQIQDAKQNLFVENLEAFGLAFVAHRRQLPFSSFLAITNLVSKKGSQEWQKNFVQYGRGLCNFLAGHLRALPF